MWVSSTPLQQEKTVGSRTGASPNKKLRKLMGKAKRRVSKGSSVGSVKNHLRKILQNLNHSQNDLARKTKVSYRVINDAYKKRVNPSARNQVRIVAALERLTGRRFDVADVFPENNG